MLNLNDVEEKMLRKFLKQSKKIIVNQLDSEIDSDDNTPLIKQLQKAYELADCLEAILGGKNVKL